MLFAKKKATIEILTKLVNYINVYSFIFGFSLTASCWQKSSKQSGHTPWTCLSLYLEHFKRAGHSKPLLHSSHVSRAVPLVLRQRTCSCLGNNVRTRMYHGGAPDLQGSWEDDFVTWLLQVLPGKFNLVLRSNLCLKYCRHLNWTLKKLVYL